MLLDIQRIGAHRCAHRHALLSRGKILGLGKTSDVMNQYLGDVQGGIFSQGQAVLRDKGIVRLEFLNKEGAVKRQFVSGETARIRFYYSFKNPVVKPSVGITFVHADSRYSLVSSTDYLFNVHSGYDGFEAKELQGNGYFEVSFDELYLPVGVYKCLTYLFAENNLNLVEKNENAAEVEVIWSAQSVKRSLIDLPRRWSIHNA